MRSVYVPERRVTRYYCPESACLLLELFDVEQLGSPKLTEVKYERALKVCRILSEYRKKGIPVTYMIETDEIVINNNGQLLRVDRVVDNFELKTRTWLQKIRRSFNIG